MVDAETFPSRRVVAVLNLVALCLTVLAYVGSPKFWMLFHPLDYGSMFHHINSIQGTPIKCIPLQSLANNSSTV